MYTSELLQLLKQLAVQAGKAIMEVYETDFQVELKEDNSPLTQADKAANEIIVTALQKAYPAYAVLSEESKSDPARLANEACFIVDPLDGTKEFVKRNGQFTVNIALATRGEAVAGVIYVPVTGLLYFAEKGHGAWLEDTASGETSPIHVTDKLDHLIWVGSKSHSSQKEEDLIASHSDLIADTISAGSSLKGCMVASGQADVYYRFGLTCEWDTAAMQCIAEAAGAIFRQMDGSPMRYNREKTLNEKGFYIVNRTENIWVGK